MATWDPVGLSDSEMREAYGLAAARPLRGLLHKGDNRRLLIRDASGLRANNIRLTVKHTRIVNEWAERHQVTPAQVLGVMIETAIRKAGDS